MAISAEDKKYLTAEGISEVQKATDDWGKANSTRDTAGMQSAAKRAAAARANSAYQISGGPGYTANGEGGYVGPIQSKAMNPAGDRDIASEIISLLTSGGKVDYAKLGTLVKEREAKVATNPSLYGQFDSTKDIISKYLPVAKQAEQEIQPQQSTPATPSSDVDTVSSLLRALVNSPTSSMGWDQAKLQASSELDPMYSQASQELKKSLDADMEQRGIYNSPLASGIMTEKQGQLSNSQASAIAQRANEIIQNNQELSLQDKQLQSSTLSSLLSSLVGRESNIADLTGYYNGQPTLARDQYNTGTELSQAALTGNYQGEPTLDAMQLKINQTNQTINNALSAVELTGKVTTQEQADLLGVPVGTPSASAKESALNRQAELEMFYSDMSYKTKSLELQTISQQYQQSADGLKDALNVWQASGVAPDSEILRQYGIAPGTAWADGKTAAQRALDDINAQLEIIGAEDELNFQTRATQLMSTYKTNRSTAEAAIIIIDSTGTKEEALAKIKAQSSTLAAEGVSTGQLNSIVSQYFFNKQVLGDDMTQGNTTNSGSNWTKITSADIISRLNRSYPNHVSGTQVKEGNNTYVWGNGSWYKVG